MVTSVNIAFDEFMTNVVNLSSSKTDCARNSRDYLRKQIKGLGDFFPLYSEKDINFGSFARRTKIRPLDDIDIIITLAGCGCTWQDGSGDAVLINDPSGASEYKPFYHEGTSNLNSRRIINYFIKRLSELRGYQKGELHRNLNAVTLKLESYEWNFDIVPAFITREDNLGRSYYLIPDGYGNWIKTDPRIDRDRLIRINQELKGRVLNVIRVMKYWQRRATMPKMSSYLLETLIINYFEKVKTDNSYIYLDVIDVLYYISQYIYFDVMDPKGLQGNLNSLTNEERKKISIKAFEDLEKSKRAFQYQKSGDQLRAIREWRQIFGVNFPNYGGD